MRSLGTRRALVAGAAAMAAVALAGCSAGQVAETALKRPSNQGLNADNADKSVAVRNLAVTYNGPSGYPANASAPLEFGLYNHTTSEIQVTVTSGKPEAAAGNGVLYGTSVGLVGPGAAGASAEPSPEPSESGAAVPAVPAPQPAKLTLPPLGSVTFLPGDPTSVQVIGLSGKLMPGQATNLTFTFSNGAEPLTVQAPMAIPLSPAPRASGIPDENTEPE